MDDIKNNDDDDVLGEATFSTGGDFIDWNEPDNLYAVELVNLTKELKPSKFRNGELQEQLVWEFKPVRYTGTGCFKWWTSKSTHEKSKFPETCVALGVPLPTPDQPVIKKSAFIGRRCRALIVHVPSTKHPGSTFPRITQVFPLT